MNVRTCLLCGKPLSRIKVGSGEDFCSREHRNQYRLRRGMDRLLEANKMASLMRRREKPKPVSAPLPMSAAPDAHRGFGLVGLKIASRAACARASLSLGAAARLRFSTGFASFPPLSPAHSDGGRLPAGVARFSPGPAGARLVVPAPAGGLSLRAGVAAAGFAALDRTPAAGRRGTLWARRAFGMLRHPVPPVQLAGGCAAHTRFQWLVPGGQPNRLALPQKTGKALRVSASAGFRIPPPEVRRLCFVLPPVAGLPRPDYSPPSVLPFTQCAVRPFSIALTISIPGLWFPAAPLLRKAPGMAWPSLVILRWSRVEWNGGGHRRPGEQPVLGTSLPVAHDALQVRLRWTGFAGGFALRFLSPRKTPAGSPPGHQLALVPFAPRETPFGYPATARDSESAAAAAPVTEPEPSLSAAPVSRPPAASIEEHFDSGWDDWIGGVADWKLDAAGVRTGSLALFIPSLEMADYEMEFLARIENRSVVWVFRAGNLRDYYLASISRSSSGYEFARSIVKDGAPEAPVTVPLHANPNAKAFTVKLRASGDSFSVSVDGRPIARWTDSRLPDGGIGFTAAPGDAARLYWIRLAHCKEDSTI